MYAIVSTGGKQYKVATDDVRTSRRSRARSAPRSSFPFSSSTTARRSSRTAKLAKAKVTAEIVEQFKGEKQLVFKFHKRKRYSRLKGHRQQLTRLKITKVQATSRAKKAAAASEAPAAE